MENALQMLAERYSETQLMKAQDIVGDLRDSLIDSKDTHAIGVQCDRIYDLLSDAINLDA